jgi:hypothetical protein
MPIGKPFDMETDVAKGQMAINIRSITGSDDALFSGRKRFLHIAVQVSSGRTGAVVHWTLLSRSSTTSDTSVDPADPHQQSSA